MIAFLTILPFFLAAALALCFILIAKGWADRG